MIVSLVEVEPTEEPFFLDSLPEHDIEFVPDLSEVTPEAEAVSVFIYSKVTAEFLDAHPRVKLIATRSSITEHIDVAGCAKRGVTVSHVPGYGENTVAEHTFALILALTRRLREALRANKQPKFLHEMLRGTDLYGQTLGVIGVGRIGQSTIRIAKGFGMEVLAFDPNPRDGMEQILGFNYVSLDQLLQAADIISLHAPHRPDTYHILNRDTFAQCKRGVIVINTAHGTLIDTQALVEALDSGQVGGAGLDVLEDERAMKQDPTSIISAQIVQNLRALCVSAEAEHRGRVSELHELMQNKALLSRPNVVFTPHIAFNSKQAVQQIHATTVKNIQAFAGGTPVNVVSAA